MCPVGGEGWEAGQWGSDMGPGPGCHAVMTAGIIAAGGNSHMTVSSFRSRAEASPLSLLLHVDRGPRRLLFQRAPQLFPRPCARSSPAACRVPGPWEAGRALLLPILGTEENCGSAAHRGRWRAPAFLADQLWTSEPGRVGPRGLQSGLDRWDHRARVTF